MILRSWLPYACIMYGSWFSLKKMFFDCAKTYFHNHLNLVFDLNFLFLIAFIVIKSNPWFLGSSSLPRTPMGVLAECTEIIGDRQTDIFI